MNYLDIFIGLASVFLTLSLIVTAIGEGLSSTLRLKSKTAEKIVKTLIGPDWCSAFYRHPSIVRLSQAKPYTRLEGLRLPSYIPPYIFVDVLLSLAATRVKRVPPFRGSETQFEVTPTSPGEINRILNELVERTDGEEGMLAGTLLELWHRANLDVDDYRNRLVRWFDDTGDRSYGWHRRKLGSWLFVAGLVVAIVMNADTIQMYKRISGDSALREALVASTTELVASKGDEKVSVDRCALAGLPSQCSSDEFIRAASAELLPVLGGQSVLEERSEVIALRKAYDKKKEKEQQDQNTDTTTGDGIESQTEDPNDIERAPAESEPLPVSEWMVWKALGLLLTACAISLGAPFWFDLLRKVVELRGRISTGSVPASNTAAGVDRTAAGLESTPAALTTLATRQVDEDSLDTLEHFEYDAPGFSTVNALWCARLSAAAYLDAAAAEVKITGEYGAQLRVFDTALAGGGESDTQAQLITTPRCAIVVFRGTEKKLDDWLTNIDIELQPPAWTSATNGKVHAGFNAALEEVWAPLSVALAEVGANDGSLPVWFTGHSLGGALATLAAQRLQGESSSAVIGGLFTFGQPRVGDSAFARGVDSRLAQRYFRSVNNRDVVPRVPLPDTPDVRSKVQTGDLKVHEYAHAGRVIYFSDLGRAIMDPPLWYRSLDTLPVADTAEALRARLGETTGDHAIDAYITLHRSLLDSPDLQA